MTLSLDEFLHRFLLHLLPKGFVRIRHFGFLANQRRHSPATVSSIYRRGLPQLSPAISCERGIRVRMTKHRTAAVRAGGLSNRTQAECWCRWYVGYSARVDQWPGARTAESTPDWSPAPSSLAMFTTLNPQNTGDPANNVVADRIPIPCSPDENLFTLLRASEMGVLSKRHSHSPVGTRTGLAARAEERIGRKRISTIAGRASASLGTA